MWSTSFVHQAGTYARLLNNLPAKPQQSPICAGICSAGRPGSDQGYEHGASNPGLSSRFEPWTSCPVRPKHAAGRLLGTSTATDTANGALTELVARDMRAKLVERLRSIQPADAQGPFQTQLA